MKTKAFVYSIIIAAMGVVSLAVCEGCKPEPPKPQIEPKHLNISIYLDLSDRIVRNMAPSPKDRDIEIVKHITEIVKKHTIDQRILPSKDRIKVFFYPAPANPKIALLSDNLEMDMGDAQPAEKKKILATFQDQFINSLNQIYNATIQNQNWIGSDIWGFFKKQVDQYCIKPNMRNIIVILTDGYIYHNQNKIQQGNKSSFILPQTLADPKAGLIVSRKGLDNLEVLVLEVNPYTPTHQGQMESILQDWFTGMGVKHLYIGETDLPTNTKDIIDNFISSK